MNPDRFAQPALSLFRMVIGLLFLFHGAASLFGVFGGSRGTGNAVPIGEWPGWWAALIQALCGGLVLVGLLTRPAALLASGSMAYAYFVVHQPDALLPMHNGGELAALFCWSFVLIAALGPGRWAVDNLLRQRRAVARPGAVEQPSPVVA
ncbi:MULTISPECIES: DoxX family protein [Micromonospora]|uniref:Putative oxidoreductase n=1 Tax=Micromonospora yangpuensis TaxID=683228 RepID=A0A1C6VDA9_9ACTN|nr:DoxX family protein [Micromonospora yangpuensis]GGM13713.1 integral membrane protein [Micromonospora yangpuensis]SCL64322.1 putative oxidoreductase [Micromonospora yangpuensis]